MPNQPLFTPYRMGDLDLPNRIVMAPLTRMRAQPHDHVPTTLQAEYYAQRASAGGEGTSTCLLLATQRCGYVVARSDNALHVLPLQGRLHLLQHSHRRNEIGICGLDIRKAV